MINELISSVSKLTHYFIYTLHIFNWLIDLYSNQFENVDTKMIIERWPNHNFDVMRVMGYAFHQYFRLSNTTRSLSLHASYGWEVHLHIFMKKYISTFISPYTQLKMKVEFMINLHIMKTAKKKNTNIYIYFQWWFESLPSMKFGNFKFSKTFE